MDLKSIPSVIFISLHTFDAAAEQSGGKFSEAVKIYVETFVLEEYRQPFLKLLDCRQR